MSVQAIISGTSAGIIQEERAESGRFSTYLPAIAKKLGAFTLGALAIYAIGNIPGADAGPLMYASCLTGCAATGPFAAACWAACLPLLGVPGP